MQFIQNYFHRSRQQLFSSCLHDLFSGCWSKREHLLWWQSTIVDIIIGGCDCEIKLPWGWCLQTYRKQPRRQRSNRLLTFAYVMPLLSRKYIQTPKVGGGKTDAKRLEWCFLWLCKLHFSLLWINMLAYCHTYDLARIHFNLEHINIDFSTSTYHESALFAEHYNFCLVQNGIFY